MCINGNIFSSIAAQAQVCLEHFFSEKLRKEAFEGNHKTHLSGKVLTEIPPIIGKGTFL